MPALQLRSARCECVAPPATCAAARHSTTLPPPRASLRLAPRLRTQRRRALAPCTALPESLALVADAAVASASAVASLPPPHAYEPPVVEPWQLWTGFVAGMAPFVIAAYEFGKRILIQRECARCGGSGLIQRTLPAGVELQPGMQPLRKCTSCGGFLPWISWRYFFTSAATPGNGGALRAPRGQTSVLYDVAAATRASEADAAAAALVRDAAARRDDADAPR